MTAPETAPTKPSPPPPPAAAPAEPASEPFPLRRLRERFGPGIVLESHAQAGDVTAVVPRERIADVLAFLKGDPALAFNFLMDLAGADLSLYPRSVPGFGGEERFQVAYHLYSLPRNARIRVKARVPESDPAIASATPLWRAADWAEREAFDMFGLRFTGHANLKRILCHKDFVGHALRKDFDIRSRQWLVEPDSLLDELGPAPPPDPSDEEGEASDLFTELMSVNVGPAHPAMHGAFRVLVRLKGETIVKAVPEIGYIHRAFEKSAERGTYTQVIPYTDRLNYCSALLNNIGYCHAVEKLLGVEVTERCQAIRVILGELSRIIDHCVCNAANLVDLGALTNFWYLFKVRERVYEVLEALTGHRLTNSFARIGGFSADLNPGFEDAVRACLPDVRQALDDVLGLLEKNRIFHERTIGVGAISAEDAISYGYTGPCLRASGVAHDLRKTAPYYGYDEYDFDVAVGENGDAYDRIMVRFEEMRQSARIIEQALAKLPGGPVNIDDPTIIIPPKKEVYASIEGLMRHFVLVYDGIKPPLGEAYGATEAANGELGFWVVSDGTGNPYRVRVRPPCFYVYSSFPQLIEGGFMADSVAVLGGLNVIAGELER